MVTVTALTRPGDALSAYKELTSWAKDLYMAYAWATSAGGKAPHWTALPLNKIKQAVIGIHFAQTEPRVLSELLQLPGVLKVVDDTAGVFHPKVLLGVRGNEARAIVGSSNLTTGGFKGNTELNVLIAGAVSDPPLRDIIEFVSAQWSGVRAFVPDADWIARYETAYKRPVAQPRVPPPVRIVATEIHFADDLNIAWPAYYDLLASQERRTLANGEEIHVFDHVDGSYIEEAENCLDAFRRFSSFAMMPREVRQLVAGTGGTTAGYFGRMVGAGFFKHLVNEAPEQLSRFIDQIPLEGDVTIESVGLYLDGIMKVRGIQIGTGTRLLVVKRPDLFLPVNGANQERLRELFGSAPSTASGYVRLHQRLWQYPWFSAPEPESLDERRAWRARTALLDAILYEIPNNLTDRGRATSGPGRAMA